MSIQFIPNPYDEHVHQVIKILQVTINCEGHLIVMKKPFSFSVCVVCAHLPTQVGR